MARGDPLQRQWDLLKRLQTRGEGVTLSELAEEFVCSERNLQRDMEMLQEKGFPLEFEVGERGTRYWRLPHDFFKLGPLVLGLTEAMSLRFAVRVFSPLAGTHFADALDELLGRLRSIVPDKALDYFAALDPILHILRSGVTDYSLHRDTIRRLDEAVREWHSVELAYQGLTNSSPFTTRFDPYGFVYYDEDLYVVGHSHVVDDLRVLKVPRVRSVTPTKETFAVPDGFDLESRFRTTFGIFQGKGPPTKVVVRFTGIAARQVEEQTWHESQRIEWLPPDPPAEAAGDTYPPDGTGEAEGKARRKKAPPPGVLLATFELSDFTEFKRWIRKHGHEAIVIEPESLREDIRDELTATLSQYDRVMTIPS